MCKDESRQAGSSKDGVTQVEVTPEMIEAGFSVLESSGIADDYLAADRLLVAEMFEAMLSADTHLLRDANRRNIQDD
jgi:hypothetical protein